MQKSEIYRFFNNRFCPVIHRFGEDRITRSEKRVNRSKGAEDIFAQVNIYSGTEYKFRAAVCRKIKLFRTSDLQLCMRFCKRIDMMSGIRRSLPFSLFLSDSECLRFLHASSENSPTFYIFGFRRHTGNSRCFHVNYGCLPIYARIPPSTYKTWPFTKSDASDARNTAGPIKSSGSPHLAAGVFEIIN